LELANDQIIDRGKFLFNGLMKRQHVWSDVTDC
jgi:hypothetical protein